MMWGFGGFGMLLWLVLIAVLIWWVVQMTQKAQSGGRGTEPTRDARGLLDERLARGEITIEQYQELRKALT